MPNLPLIRTRTSLGFLRGTLGANTVDQTGYDRCFVSVTRPDTLASSGMSVALSGVEVCRPSDERDQTRATRSTRLTPCLPPPG